MVTVTMGTVYCSCDEMQVMVMTNDHNDDDNVDHNDNAINNKPNNNINYRNVIYDMGMFFINVSSNGYCCQDKFIKLPAKRQMNNACRLDWQQHNYRNSREQSYHPM